MLVSTLNPGWNIWKKLFDKQRNGLDPVEGDRLPENWRVFWRELDLNIKVGEFEPNSALLGNSNLSTSEDLWLRLTQSGILPDTPFPDFVKAALESIDESKPPLMHELLLKTSSNAKNISDPYCEVSGISRKSVGIQLEMAGNMGENLSSLLKLPLTQFQEQFIGNKTPALPMRFIPNLYPRRLIENCKTLQDPVVNLEPNRLLVIFLYNPEFTDNFGERYKLSYLDHEDWASTFADYLSKHGGHVIWHTLELRTQIFGQASLLQYIDREFRRDDTGAHLNLKSKIERSAKVIVHIAAQGRFDEEEGGQIDFRPQQVRGPKAKAKRDTVKASRLAAFLSELLGDKLLLVVLEMDETSKCGSHNRNLGIAESFLVEGTSVIGFHDKIDHKSSYRLLTRLYSIIVGIGQIRTSLAIHLAFQNFIANKYQENDGDTGLSLESAKIFAVEQNEKKTPKCCDTCPIVHYPM